MPITLTDKQLALVRLMMDPAAAPGEIQNASGMLTLSFRKQGCSAEEIATALQSTSRVVMPKAPKYTRPDYGLITCPFKKHKGEQACDIPADYLRWCINMVRTHQDESFKKRFSQWADDMECFLAQ